MKKMFGKMWLNFSLRCFLQQCGIMCMNTILGETQPPHQICWLSLSTRRYCRKRLDQLDRLCVRKIARRDYLLRPLPVREGCQRFSTRTCCREWIFLWIRFLARNFLLKILMGKVVSGNFHWIYSRPWIIGLSNFMNFNWLIYNTHKYQSSLETKRVLKKWHFFVI